MVNALLHNAFSFLISPNPGVCVCVSVLCVCVGVVSHAWMYTYMFQRSQYFIHLQITPLV